MQLVGSANFIIRFSIDLDAVGFFLEVISD